MQLDFNDTRLFNPSGDFTKLRSYKRTGNEIIGLHSCYCHAFDSVAELKKAEKQKFTPGQFVISRCGGEKGIVTSAHKDSPSYYHVTTGPLARDQRTFHKTNIYLNPLQI